MTFLLRELNISYMYLDYNYPLTYFQSTPQGSSNTVSSSQLHTLLFYNPFMCCLCLHGCGTTICQGMRKLPEATIPRRKVSHCHLLKTPGLGGNLRGQPPPWITEFKSAWSCMGLEQLTRIVVSECVQKPWNFQASGWNWKGLHWVRTFGLIKHFNCHEHTW